MARVFVGLSGGVDSALSAALLKDEGHTVTGCFIRIWRPEFLECTWREDRLDALRVAAHLGIPFKEVDLSAEYERDVIKDMIDTYVRGETPNPDTLCNARIKFDAFQKWALAEGADIIATGHYARLEREPLRLCHAADATKDQTYFLSRVPSHALTRALFPVGSLQKKDVRARARERALPVAEKKDSQGLCFVGDVSLPEFLSRYIQIAPGRVLGADGRRIGTHRGAAYYTIGQRHGIQVSDTRPYYVTHINTRENTITVSADIRDAHVTRIRLRELNWLHDVREGAVLSCVPRYHHAPVTGTLTANREEVHIDLAEPVIAVPGQTCAMYDHDVVVGAGIIC
jgi:tRNA-uridine 2-sulfurtransferase